MKHFTAILFLLLASMNSAFAIHSFVNESKLWHCKKWKQAFLGQEDRYYYFQGDTVINGITAKKMYLKFSKESDKGNYQAALYEEGQKVYCCYPNQKGFELEYDFGAKKGEKVTTSSFTYMVEDVEEMKVGDETLRVLHLYILHDLLNEKDSVTWVEGVGAESAPCYSGPNFTGGYEYFIDCEIDGKVFLKAEDIPDPTPNTPVDMTSHIVNPNYDNNDNEGWSGTTPLFQTYTNAEHYNKTFDTWQDITDLPNGVYKLTVQGIYEPNHNYWFKYKNGTTPQYAKFYATNGVDSTIVPVPNIYDGRSDVSLGDDQYNYEEDNHSGSSFSIFWTPENKPKSASKYFTAGHYSTDLYFTVTNNNLRIGVKMPIKTGDRDWVCWDNWKLSYYGDNNEIVYSQLIKEMIDCNLAKFDTVTAKMTTGIVEQYKETISNLAATDIKSFYLAKQTIDNAGKSVERNIENWKTFLDYVEWGNRLVQADYIYWGDNKRALDDYLREKAEDYITKGILTTEELLAQNKQLDTWIQSIIIAGCPTVTNWSYVSFDKSSANGQETNSYTRYSVGGLVSVGKVSYNKLLEYTACDDRSAGNDVKTYRIRFDGNRIYILKEDAPDYAKQGIILKEEGLDYLLYDFDLKEGEEFCKYTENGKDTISVTISERSSVTCSNGQTFNVQRLSMGTASWIETWGSTEELLYPFKPNHMERDNGSSLNYAFLMEGHEEPLFYYNPFGDIAGVSTAFKTNDCALEEYSWLTIEENTIKKPYAQVHTIGQTLLCTSPTAVKLEVYTMDAVKVGEADFANGEATVKVGKVPATYLYIVTNPDGRRESGKVVVKN